MKGVNLLKITVLMDDAVPGNTDLVAQHSASFFLEIKAEKEKTCVLVDVGQSSKALFHNMSRLNIDPESIDILVLTHCHYDHTGAVVDLLRASKKKTCPSSRTLPSFGLTSLVNPSSATLESRKEMGLWKSKQREEGCCYRKILSRCARVLSF